MEEIPLLRGHGGDAVVGVFCGEVVRTHKSGQVSASSHLLVDAGGDFLGLVPFSHEWLNLLLNKGADLGTQGDMTLVVVWGVIL